VGYCGCVLFAIPIIKLTITHSTKNIDVRRKEWHISFCVPLLAVKLLTLRMFQGTAVSVMSQCIKSGKKILLVKKYYLHDIFISFCYYHSNTHFHGHFWIWFLSLNRIMQTTYLLNLTMRHIALNYNICVQGKS
jgi:hypothetical protein